MPSPPLLANPVFASQQIQYVMIIVQENRSFDNLFYGFPGADSAQSGMVNGVGAVPLQAVPLEAGVDVAHFHTSFIDAYDNGLLDGFNSEGEFALQNGSYAPVPAPFANYPYAYVPTMEVQPYWQLASQFTLGDRMFQSNSGPSFPAHQYLIAGQSNYMVEVPNHAPWGCDAPAGTAVAILTATGAENTPGVFPCQDYNTLGDELDQNHVSWRYYAPKIGTAAGNVWSAYDAVRHIRYGPDWTSDVISPETTVLSDIADGRLPQVSWVIPSLPNSDHAISGTNLGPQWVANVVNAVGASKYWKNTAIFVLWDDWGGWYDHVAPPARDIMGDGFRVPIIVVSPYAKHGYVSHVNRDFGSILHFVEDTFALPRLGHDDVLNVDDFNDCFDFTQTVTPLHPVSTFVNAQYFARQQPSLLPPDDDDYAALRTGRPARPLTPR